MCSTLKTCRSTASSSGSHPRRVCSPALSRCPWTCSPIGWRTGLSEQESLLGILGQAEGLESLEDNDVVEAELVSDDEVVGLLEADWQRLGLPIGPAESGGLESVDSGPPTDDELAAALASAPRSEVHELQAWLEERQPTGIRRPRSPSMRSDCSGTSDSSGPCCE